MPWWPSCRCRTCACPSATPWPIRTRLPVRLRGHRLDRSCRRSSSRSPTGSHLFPCLDLAYRAGRTGDLAPAWLNAANEVAVAAFLAGRIAWTAIAEVVEATLDRYDAPTSATASAGGPEAAAPVDDVLDADATARRAAEAVVMPRGRRRERHRHPCDRRAGCDPGRRGRPRPVAGQVAPDARPPSCSSRIAVIVALAVATGLHRPARRDRLASSSSS